VPQVFATRTVLENLVMAMALAEQTGLALLADPWTEERVSAARRMLSEYGIAEHADREAGLVSQGVRKLLDIAMAMAHRPKILLLDEPTSGVSQEEKHTIMATIMDALDREGVTVLFVEHDMDIVARYAQRVLAFMEGRIIADGPPEAALNHPKVLEVIVGEGSVRRQGSGGQAHA
jgi:branched-chain amino acid transport system ATP-binding protein